VKRVDYTEMYQTCRRISVFHAVLKKLWLLLWWGFTKTTFSVSVQKRSQH